MGATPIRVAVSTLDSYPAPTSPTVSGRLLDIRREGGLGLSLKALSCLKTVSENQVSEIPLSGTSLTHWLDVLTPGPTVRAWTCRACCSAGAVPELFLDLARIQVIVLPARWTHW